MAQKDREDIRSALLKKGFYCKDNDHEYYHFTLNNAVFTKISRGSKYKTYTDKLLGKIKRQLKLNTSQQLNDFIECPMTLEEYTKILKALKLID